ncbi:MAG: four-carbon acid sugar kinase family protein, partial [Cyanobacteria bacterium P01_F01_bin.86]
MEDLVEGLTAEEQMFFVLTNTRAMPESKACQISREIGENLLIASARTKQKFTIISRSDSTLRGHYPAELDVIAESIDQS